MMVPESIQKAGKGKTWAGDSEERAAGARAASDGYKEPDGCFATGCGRKRQSICRRSCNGGMTGLAVVGPRLWHETFQQPLEGGAEDEQSLADRKTSLSAAAGLLQGEREAEQDGEVEE